MTPNLAKAIAREIEHAFSATADKYVRVNLRPAWPVVEALNLVSTDFPLILGPLDSDWLGVVDGSRFQVESEASALTRFRNDAFATRQTQVLVLGDATGIGQQGLKDIVTISKSDVLNRWRSDVETHITSTESKYAGRNAEIAVAISRALFRLAASEQFFVGRLDEYLKETLPLGVSDAETFHQQIWRLQLIPDAALSQLNGITKRLRLNASKIDELKQDFNDDKKLFARLSASPLETVKSFCKWLEFGSDDDLAKSDLQDILDALKNDSPSVTKSIEILEALGRPERFQDRSGLLEAIRTEVNQEDLAFQKDIFAQVSSVIKDSVQEDQESFEESSLVFLRVKAATDHLDLDKKQSRSDFDEKPDSETDLSLFGAFRLHIVSETEENQETVSLGMVANMLSRYMDSSVVDDYVAARVGISGITALLSADDSQVLSLLVVSSQAKLLCQQYVQAWENLLSSYISTPEFPNKNELGMYLGLLDGRWVRQLKAGEDLQEPELKIDDEFTEVTLAPFHPWRIGPLSAIADEVEMNFEGKPGVTSSAAWAINRAIPAFRLIQVGAKDLNFLSSEAGSLKFGSQNRSSLPQLTGQGSLLKRVFDAYGKLAPWSEAGSIFAFVNPPVGGMLRKTMSRVSQNSTGNSALVSVRDRKTVGVERVNEENNAAISISLDVEQLGEWFESNAVSRDVTVVFYPGNRSKPVGQSLGAHSSVKVVLENDGFSLRDGVAKFTPQIQLSPDDKNSLVSNLWKISGNEVAKNIEQELAAPDELMKLLPKLAAGSNWVVLGVPGSIAGFTLEDQYGSSWFQVAEFDEGSYRFFVFTRSVEQLREVIRPMISQIPLGNLQPKEVEEALEKLTQSNPQKFFDVALKKYGVIESLGLLNARALAKTYFDNDDLILEFSLDNTSWTQQWSGHGGQRADLVFVGISSAASTENPVKVLVVEAKASLDSVFSAPKLTDEPYAEASEQVQATRDFIARLLCDDNLTAIETLQSRTLIEQIATKAATAYANFASKNDLTNAMFKKYFEHISSLGLPGADKPVTVNGLVVSTYLTALHETRVSKVQEFGLTLVAASSKLLRDVIAQHEIFDVWSQDPSPSQAGNQPNVEGENSRPTTLGQQSENDLVDDTPNEHESERVSEPEEDDSLEQQSDVGAGQDADQGGVDVLIPDPHAGQHLLLTKLHQNLRRRTDHIGDVKNVTSMVGPTFISFDFDFAKGETLQPLIRVKSDLARDIGVPSIEISNSPVPGKIRVLVPRPDRQFPALPDDSISPCTDDGGYLPIRVGVDLSGRNHTTKLSNWPHALVAGATGSGKSVFLKSLLAQLNNFGPDYCRVMIVDGKAEADYLFAVAPEMYLEEFPEVLMGVDTALDALSWLRDHELPRRKKLIRDASIKRGMAITAKSMFVEAVISGQTPDFLPLVVVIDEFNEIMLRGGKAKQAFEDAVTSIAQTARSVMVHLVLATQRPDRNVVVGSLKANLPARVAFRLPTAADSLTVLGHGGAEDLLGLGDMLFQINGEDDIRIQSYNVP